MTKFENLLLPEDELLFAECKKDKPAITPNGIKLLREAEVAQYTVQYLNTMGEKGYWPNGYRIINTRIGVKRVYVIFTRLKEE